MDTHMPWQKPAVEIKQVKFIALAPVSWGDGFMRDVSILALQTACGKIGLGSAYTSANKLQTVWAQYKDHIHWHALNPAQTEDWVKTAAKLPENKGFDGTGPDTIPGLSAINIALWDLLGQCLAQPLSNLIGTAYWKSLPAYASLELDYDLTGPDKKLEQNLTQAMDRGFNAIKLYLPRFGYHTADKPAAAWQALEESYLRTARQIVGPDITLMLDTFGSAVDWPNDTSWAEHIRNVLAEEKYLWFEEPLSPENTEGHLALKSTSGPKISGGEFFTDPDNFKYWAEHQVVDILQPDCTISGGLSTLLHAREHAQKHGLAVIPHGWSSAVGLAADVQFLAANQPDALCFVEYMPGPHVKDIVTNNPFSLDSAGNLSVPTSPGLGIELNWHLADSNTFPFAGIAVSTP